MPYGSLLLWGVTAGAAELRAVREGESVESLAIELGDPGLAGEIRRLNQLGPTEQAQVGQVLTLPPPLVDHAEQEAFLVAARGEVRLGPDGPALSPLVPVPRGEQVCTGPSSFARLRLATTCTREAQESDDLLLPPSSCLRVESAFASAWGRSAVVRLESGAVVIPPRTVASGAVTVLTPAGWTSGARGGFRVNLEAAAMRAEALEAAVAVQGAGVEVRLQENQGSRVKQGEVPSAPINLLVAGELVTPAAGGELRAPHFAWAGPAEAFGFQLQLASDAAFEDVIYQADLPESAHRPELLLLPVDVRELYWRVAPFDRFRFLGVPSEGRLVRVPGVD